MKRKLVTVDAETLLATPMSKTMFIVDGLIPQGVECPERSRQNRQKLADCCGSACKYRRGSLFGESRPCTATCCISAWRIRSNESKTGFSILTDDSTRSFHLAVTCGLIGNGLEEEIINFLEDPENKLVIIDTLQKVRDSKGSAGKRVMYGNDYDDISAIKRIADEHVYFHYSRPPSAKLKTGRSVQRGVRLYRHHRGGGHQLCA